MKHAVNDHDDHIIPSGCVALVVIAALTWVFLLLMALEII